jgi:DNA-binding NarL/FixJ family response regulator
MSGVIASEAWPSLRGVKDQKSCVLLAERHHDLRDGVRGLFETSFDTVFMVADEASLLEGAGRLRPALVVIDIALSGGDLAGLLARVSERAPGSKLLVLSVHDEITVAEAALAAGADGIVLKRSLSSDLMLAVDALRAGRRYLSPGISAPKLERPT